ncbi:MAG TPA: LysR family transcriptional regulator [Archangium sp.]|uniref:LysR family transcriptional regulator n=1 Tax=Archangium sp. TaxID=1872627 RepID=UPI002E364169|nr:LysR family transcriptional regulator [Archangium sp.]HEX5747181.1 LysR family transcriptional regulator [Archangium sp.]
MVDLNEMQLFVRVVREQGFTRAAKALGMPKSTVSERISRLEERLGVRLLHRTTRSVQATEVGQAYYEECTRIIAQAEEADARVRDASTAPRGLVRVTAPQLFGQAFLGTAVAEFLARYPETEVELVLTDRKVDLVEEGFDLAIRAVGDTDASLVMRKLGDADLLCCASPRYLRAHGTPATPEALSSLACIVFGTSRQGHTWSFEREGETRRVRIRARYAVNSFPLVRQAALAGLGIAHVPRFLCSEELRTGKLVPVLEEWSTGQSTLRALYPSRRHLSAAVRALLDLLVERFARQPPWK